MSLVFKSLGLVALCFAASVKAIPVVVSASSAGQVNSSIAGVSTVDFDGSNCAGYASCTGDFALVAGSVSGKYAQPFGTLSTFLSVPNPSDTTHTAVMNLGLDADYFGLFWGSIDTYNVISFFSGDTQVASFSGSDLPSLNANGDQTEWSSNRYINFDFGPASFNTVKFISTGFAFESDNHAYRNASVPEPMNMALMGLGLFGLLIARRFSRK
jgi:hypothetical protein